MDGEDNVRPISGQRVQSRLPDVQPDVVKLLEDLLEEARAGQLVGIVSGLVYHDGQGTFARAGLMSLTSVGGITVALHKFCNDFEENE